MKINSLSSVCTAALFSAVFAGGCPQDNTESVSPAPSRQTSTAVSQTAVVADTVVFVQSEPSKPKRSDEPSEPKKAGAGDWSSDDIQRDPYGFIQEQIRDCDRLKAKIESQKISLTRLGKQSARTIEESDGTVARYTAFLAAAKKAYKEAEAADKWPAVVNGFELDEDALSDRIADALERIELAKKDREAAVVLGKKVDIRQKAIKAKARELASLRLKLVQQADQVKTNVALAELGNLSTVLGTLRDMALEIENGPTEASLDDLAVEDPDAAKKSAVRAFLDE